MLTALLVKLPAEEELAARFGVHRHTLRRAIDELVDAGLVERRHGLGTFVVRGPVTYALSGRTRFTATLGTLGREADSTVLRKQRIVAEGGVASRLRLAPGTPITWVETLRRVDRAPFYLISHSLADPWGQSVFADYEGGSLHSFLEPRFAASLKGRTMALGDVISTSSFTYPVAMTIRAGLDPSKDLARVRLAGSHAKALAALRDGLVDAAGASFDSFEKVVRSGALDGNRFRVLAKSEPIPNPPLAMHPALHEETKRRLRLALDTVHLSEGVNPQQIRGYGGKRVDRYDASITLADLRPALETMSPVDDRMHAALLRRAAER